MKFYHCFYTDLPDQFVEANADRLIKWVDGWADKNRYYQRSRVIDMVPVDVVGNAKVNDWPTLRAASLVMVSDWTKKKGDQFNGRYWESLAEDQRSPARIASDPGRDQGASWYTYVPSPFSSASSAASRRMIQIIAQQYAVPSHWLADFEEKPKPPLKRAGIVAGEIVGYRCWRLECGLLRSVYQSDLWAPGKVLEGRELGDWDNRGIHAWRNGGSKEYHDYIRGYLNRRDDPFTRAVLFGSSEKEDEDRPAMVTGTVFLWGDVVEHERGYRAEFARVRSLDWLYPDATMMGREQEVLDSLREKYSVTAPSPAR